MDAGGFRAGRLATCSAVPVSCNESLQVAFNHAFVMWRSCSGEPDETGVSQFALSEMRFKHHGTSFRSYHQMALGIRSCRSIHSPQLELPSYSILPTPTPRTRNLHLTTHIAHLTPHTPHLSHHNPHITNTLQLGTHIPFYTRNNPPHTFPQLRTCLALMQHTISILLIF